MTDKMREFVDEVKQLCKDFSDQRDRPYMGDVHAALDGLYEQWQAAQAEQSVPVVGDVVAGAIVSEEGEWPQFTGTPNLFNLPVGDYSLIIKPTHSITTAELERLRKCEAVLVHVRSVLPMDKWADDSRRMIDAAIAAEGEKE